MSMNMSGSGNSAGDAEMSEATSADQELALGVLCVSLFSIIQGCIVISVLVLVEDDLKV